MKRHRWQILLGTSLAVLSLSLYLLHYGIFRDSRHIVIYLIGDLAFLPVQVLFVTLIVDRLLARREKAAILKNLYTVIGVFFSELGTALLRDLTVFAPESRAFGKNLLVGGTWNGREFAAAADRFRRLDVAIDGRLGDFPALRALLLGKREFLVLLLENPNLLEHESFTDLLWAVFHLADELGARRDVSALAEADRIHLEGDIRRAYVLLVTEWLAYMRHLKEEYPYLFSLAVRLQPFDPEARAEVA